MKHGNLIQWIVIAVALGAGAIVWFKPKGLHQRDAQTTVSFAPKPLQVPEEAPETIPSNDVTAAVAPVQFFSESGLTAATAKTIAAKAWAEASDILAQVGGVHLTKSAHPQMVVTATILDLHDERHQFKGYNIESSSLQTLCSLRVQVLDATSGSVAFSRKLEGMKSDTQSAVVKDTTPEIEREADAVAAALHKLDNDPEFKKAVSRFKAKPTPTNTTSNLTP